MNGPVNVAQHGESRIININDKVRLKPTETGCRMIVQAVDEFNDYMRKWRPSSLFREKIPEMDDDGYISGQFWCLMRYFKDASWQIGKEAPFNDLEKIQ